MTTVNGEDKPGLLARLRERYGWFDHLMRAAQRYSDRQGNFYAAGLTYFTIFAMFPMLMLGFAGGGFILSRRPDMLRHTEEHIRASVPGKSGEQLIELMASAIDSRTSVGIIGLAVAAWAGLSWMDKLREALSEMWEQRADKPGFVATKLSDLVAMVSAFAALLVTIGLTALSDPKLMAGVLGWLRVPDFALLGGLLRAASLLMSVLVGWLLFTWMIARLPREPVGFACAARAGLLAAVGFEVFKQVGSVYLRSVVSGPAGATFGPVLGLMVFAYITATLILFSTAWAAVSEPADSLFAAIPGPPGRVVIASRPDGGLRAGQVLAAAAAGAIGALGISRLLRRRED